MSESSVHGPAFAATVGLALISGLFLLAAYTLNATRHRRIEQRLAQGLSHVDAALKVQRELSAALAAAEVGPVLCAVGAGWTGVPALALWLRRLMPPFSGAGVVAGTVAFVLTGAVFTLVGVVLPRWLAVRRPEPLAAATAPVARALYWVLSPLVYALHWLTLGLSRLAGPAPGPGERDRGREAQLKLFSLASRRLGLLGEVQRELLAHVFEHEEARLRQVMTPRTEMACIAATMRVKEALEAVRHLGFTRFPVCDRDKDHVIGVVHIRELLDAADTHPRRPVTDVMSSAITLSEEMPVGDALKEMLAHRVHLAIVVNDHGATAGLVTTEDLVGELAGERPYRPGQAERWKPLGPGLFEFDGDLLMEELEDALDVDLEHAGIETVGTYIAGKLGRKPHAGDIVRLDGLRFDVLDVKGTRITRLRVQKERAAREPVKPA